MIETPERCTTEERDRVSDVEAKDTGRVVREAMLYGPNGSVLFRSVWGPDGRLFTFFLFGGGG